jgi:hypothetical protein
LTPPIPEEKSVAVRPAHAGHGPATVTFLPSDVHVAVNCPPAGSVAWVSTYLTALCWSMVPPLVNGLLLGEFKLEESGVDPEPVTEEDGLRRDLVGRGVEDLLGRLLQVRPVNLAGTDLRLTVRLRLAPAFGTYLRA